MKKINKEYLDDIIYQIKQGYGDTLFFIDAERYFNDDIRIKTIRSLAKIYVNEFLMKSELNRENGIIKFHTDLSYKFSFFELNAIQVFRQMSSQEIYYDKNGKANEERINQLLDDIDRGLCDIYLTTDSTFYNYIYNQNKIAELSINRLIQNNIQNISNIN